MRANQSNLAVNVLQAQATLTATPSRAAGNTVDRKTGGNLYNAVSFHYNVGIGGITFDISNYIGLIVEESDDNSTFTPVTSASKLNFGVGFTATIDSSGRTLLIQAAKAAADTFPLTRKIDYLGDKRYVAVRPVFVGTHGTGTPVSVIAVYASPAYQPV